MRGVFIVGTGRSGTHFTVRLMNGFANARDPLGGKENPKILSDIAKAAIHHRLPSQETTQYYRDLLAVGQGVILDQHHPNLFLVRHWANNFDGLVFLFPQRPIHQIVASMLRHDGVMGWYRYASGWKQRTINRIPYPNRFLGIDRFADIRALPAHLLCARRVIAHRNAYASLVGEMNGMLRSINYEALVEAPMNEFSRIFTPDEMADLGEFTLIEKPQKNPAVKFKDVLSDTQVAEIFELEGSLCKA